MLQCYNVMNSFIYTHCFLTAHHNTRTTN